MNRRASGATIGIPTTGVITRRLLAGVVVALGAFVLAHQTAVELIGAEPTLAVIVGTGAALLVGAAALGRTIAPLVATQADLQERYEAARADALRDPLTGLGNHRAFHEELERQVEASLRYGSPVSLMLIDLDEFKSVNDTNGHAGGDRILRGFGQVLSAAVRRADLAYRVGGDEFAVLLPQTNLEGARIVARRILAQALQPVLRLENVKPVSFSAGLSAVPELADSGARLYSQADSALYAAKRGGRTDIVAYDPAVDTSATHAAPGTASAAISEVIARRQLRPVYQPIVALASGAVIGVEGLIRPVPPAPFADPGALFTAAAAGGRLSALDMACIEVIVSGAGELPPEQFLSLNVSPPTIEALEFSSLSLLAILGHHGFSPHRLVIELTEQQAIHDAGRVRERLDILRRAGVRIAADDIGSGNSGLRLLSEISFDVLKVDLGLVQSSAAGGPSSAVLSSVVALASRMDALVIAEGIEQASQVAQLVELGIDAGQGYHLGRPGALHDAIPKMDAVPVAAMSAWRDSLGLPTAS